jgi:hypothetical protein
MACHLLVMTVSLGVLTLRAVGTNTPPVGTTDGKLLTPSSLTAPDDLSLVKLLTTEEKDDA